MEALECFFLFFLKLLVFLKVFFVGGCLVLSVHRVV